MTIKEAKLRLNALVDAAVRGEQVVLMRGSKHVAAIVPVSAEELELPPRLTDDQAERFWHALAHERDMGTVASFTSANAAIANLSGRAADRRGGRGRVGRTRRRPAR